MRGNAMVKVMLFDRAPTNTQMPTGPAVAHAASSTPAYDEDCSDTGSERSRGPLKGPRDPFKGPRGPWKRPRGPFKGARGPFKGARGPFKGPRADVMLLFTGRPDELLVGRAD